VEGPVSCFTLQKFAYIVWCPENGEDDPDDGRVFESHDAEAAARRWGERQDWSSAEYNIVSERSMPVVHVQDPEGKVTRWRVSGYSVPIYTATELP
jgi:hypothetical protein